ncbi:DNA-binding response regulator, NarL/FixJ family, contains REC and HTH domains [Maribacter aquivivus]|uniref:DNA-binding response regulator, NarL/FixJ family, contains REC and HTH domains n=1 Tax=Maribacter aquivivus TaxID=228958 RepID=A0A1M6R0Q4_9FLAO|nr:response regulator transcription factor [Maribacter aquivivus]SHK26013.1 DNA-binding response regulator, NarL/FixJ family, contains REC and HTH domains [Maribacter aquivivus]
MNTVRILAVDDHEMTALGYKYILEDSEFADFNVKVEIATSFEKGKTKIETSKRAVPYDVILLDIQLFSPESKDPRTGIDLGIVARNEVPNSKVVFMSSYSDNYRINNIFKTVNPDGYMVKSEIDEMSLKTMVETIVNESPYYTASALSAIRRRMSTNIVIDEQDQKILYHLSQGIHTRDIAPLIGSANTTVEARKRQLKALFDVKNGNDLALINEAKTRGFL